MRRAKCLRNIFFRAPMYAGNDAALKIFCGRNFP
jgi:hypothetical protein